jgi:hypothetical protein
MKASSLVGKNIMYKLIIIKKPFLDFLFVSNEEKYYYFPLNFVIHNHAVSLMISKKNIYYNSDGKWEKLLQINSRMNKKFDELFFFLVGFGQRISND